MDWKNLKNQIEHWQCTPVIYKLMKEYKWNYKTANQWFKDFMRWLYTSQRWEVTQQLPFIMDNVHHLDEVWHTYILYTQEYTNMCNTLFGRYVHHQPGGAFENGEMDTKVFQKQLEFLMKDWGEEYIDRVWSYGADIADIVNDDNIAQAV